MNRCIENLKKLYEKPKLRCQNKELKQENRELKTENKKIKQENKKIKDENEQNRNDIDDLKLQMYHSKKLAEKTLDSLESLQEIDRSGIDEKEKVKHRNNIINYLRIRNINIIKELDASGKCI